MTGILPINKEAGMTSFSVVSKVRGITGERKAGHGGTLDPMATGVLPVLLGGATRFLDYLPDQRKGYRAFFRLGIKTDTLDITGKVLSAKPVQADRRAVEQALAAFRGEISQVPPMFSAISKDGVRLYDLARRGIEVEREARAVVIERLELTSFDETAGEYSIDVVCSKGTYIRSLIDDIGQVLGCGAVMTALCRTLAARFHLGQCATLNELRAVQECGGDYSQYLIPVEQVFAEYPPVYVTPAQATRFFNGGALDLERLRPEPNPGLCRVYGPEQQFLGLGDVQPDSGQMKVKRLLVKRD